MNTFVTGKSRAMRITLAIVLAVLLAFAMVAPLTADAAVGVGYTSYTITPYSWTPPSPPPASADTNQYIYLDFNYTGTLTATANLASAFTITIAGSDISASRPFTIADPTGTSTFRIVIPPDVSGFTADYNGEITIVSKGLGDILTVGGVAVDDINIHSVIPLKIPYTKDVEGTSNTAQITITDYAQVRGMFYIGVYTNVPGKGLVPIYTPGAFGVGVYTAHDHNFFDPSMDPAGIAKTIVTALDGNLPSGYSVAFSGTSTVSVTGPTGESVYLYLFNDYLIQAVDDAVSGGLGTVTFDTIIAAGGVLPSEPAPF
jgi:hypothetical protein